MLFVTGPTGSGKSSTLYAALREILEKDINVSTIEDPSNTAWKDEQVQINDKAGFNFASALRSSAASGSGRDHGRRNPR